MKADMAVNVTKKGFRGFCFKKIPCYCILQCSECCAILSVPCAQDFKKTVGFFSIPRDTIKNRNKVKHMEQLFIISTFFRLWAILF